MKLAELDAPFMNEDGKEVWKDNPITQEQCDLQEATRQAVLDALATCGDGEASELIKTIDKIAHVEVKGGIPWTFRRAVINALYAHEFPNQPKDKPFTQEDMALASSLVVKTIDANGELPLETRQMELIKRMAFESNQHKRVMYPLFNALTE